MVDYFRADKRDFAEGDRITTAGEYRDRLGDGAGFVEDTIERLRPPVKPPRQACLFLYEDETAARKHWSVMTDGKLYRVVVCEHDVLHRADMALLDIMKSAAEHGQDFADLARQYWGGECSPEPVIEIMVHDARVTEIVSKSQEERRAYLKKLHRHSLPRRTRHP